MSTKAKKQSYVRIQLFPHNEGNTNMSRPGVLGATRSGFYFRPVELNVKVGSLIRLGRRVETTRSRYASQNVHLSSGVKHKTSVKVDSVLAAVPGSTPLSRGNAEDVDNAEGGYYAHRGSNVAAFKEVVDYPVNDPAIAGTRIQLEMGLPPQGSLGATAHQLLEQRSATGKPSGNTDLHETVKVPVTFIAFRSKVVSRSHAELWVGLNSKIYFRDNGSSSGTFLNRMRLSPSGNQSKPYVLNSGDVLQLGVDYQSSQREMLKCVVIKFISSTNTLIRSKKNNERLGQAIRQLTATMSLSSQKSPPDYADSSSDCCICLGKIVLMQAIFFAACSHMFHYRCVVPLLRGGVMFLCPLCRQATNLESRCFDTLSSLDSEEKDFDQESEQSNDDARSQEVPGEGEEKREMNGEKLHKFPTAAIEISAGTSKPSKPLEGGEVGEPQVEDSHHVEEGSGLHEERRGTGGHQEGEYQETSREKGQQYNLEDCAPREEVPTVNRIVSNRDTLLPQSVALDPVTYVQLPQRYTYSAYIPTQVYSSRDTEREPEPQRYSAGRMNGPNGSRCDNQDENIPLGHIRWWQGLRYDEDNTPQDVNSKSPNLGYSGTSSLPSRYRKQYASSILVHGAPLQRTPPAAPEILPRQGEYSLPFKRPHNLYIYPDIFNLMAQQHVDLDRNVQEQVSTQGRSNHGTIPALFYGSEGRGLFQGAMETGLGAPHHTNINVARSNSRRQGHPTSSNVFEALDRVSHNTPLQDTNSSPQTTPDQGNKKRQWRLSLQAKRSGTPQNAARQTTSGVQAWGGTPLVSQSGGDRGKTREQ